MVLLPSPIKPPSTPGEMGSGNGQDDTCHCMCGLVCLTGNLEHVIRWLMLLSSSCVSGIEAGPAIELQCQNNAALEKGFGACERGDEEQEKNSVALWILFLWFLQELEPFTLFH